MEEKQIRYIAGGIFAVLAIPFIISSMLKIADLEKLITPIQIIYWIVVMVCLFGLVYWKIKSYQGKKQEVNQLKGAFEKGLKL